MTDKHCWGASYLRDKPSTYPESHFLLAMQRALRHDPVNRQSDAVSISLHMLDVPRSLSDCWLVLFARKLSGLMAYGHLSQFTSYLGSRKQDGVIRWQTTPIICL